MNSDPNDLIRDYLVRLEEAIKDLPYIKGKELVLDIESHIYESLENSGSKDEVEVLNILERLGEPEDVVKEYMRQMNIEKGNVDTESTTLGDRPYQSHYSNEGIPPWVVIISVALIFPIGIILLWISQWWATKHKLIATLIPVVGVFLMLIMGFGAFSVYRGAPHIIEDRLSPSIHQKMSIDTHNSWKIERVYVSEGIFNRSVSIPENIEISRIPSNTITQGGNVLSSLLRDIGGLIGVPIMFLGMISTVFSPFISAVYLALTKASRPII